MCLLCVSCCCGCVCCVWCECAVWVCVLICVHNLNARVVVFGCVYCVYVLWWMCYYVFGASLSV